MSSPSYVLLFLSQCLVQLHRQLERNILLRLVHAVNLLQQGQLEGLRDLFFGSPALPVRRKPGGGGASLYICHRAVPPMEFSWNQYTTPGRNKQPV